MEPQKPARLLPAVASLALLRCRSPRRSSSVRSTALVR